MKKVNIILVLLGSFSLSINAQHNYDNQSVIYSNNGRIGVGTNSPLRTFHLYDAGIDSKFLLESKQPGVILKETDATANENWWIDNNKGEFRILTTSDALINWQTALKIKQSSGTPTSFYLNGNVGIGTTSPNEKLEVDGKIRADYLRIDSENPTSVEGGEIMLDGANGFNDWRIDNYQGKFRLHHSGTNQFTVHSNGQVGIGTGNSSLGSHKLAVQGSIGAREIKVEATGWSDFVFENDYELRTLEEVEQHIAEKGHLPEIPSEAEVIENGINLGEMDAKLLQKIEELTLYMIDMNKQVQQLKSENIELKEKVQSLENE